MPVKVNFKGQIKHYVAAHSKVPPKWNSIFALISLVWQNDGMATVNVDRCLGRGDKLRECVQRERNALNAKRAHKKNLRAEKKDSPTTQTEEQFIPFARKHKFCICVHWSVPAVALLFSNVLQVHSKLLSRSGGRLLVMSLVFMYRC